VNPEDSFRDTMRKAGLGYNGPLLPDGKPHRVKASGDKRADTWYVLHVDPPAAGVFGNWHTGAKERWCEARKDRASQADWETIRRRWEEGEYKRQRIEAGRRAKAAKIAVLIFARAGPADPSHPYLARKRVGVHGDLRQRGDLLVLPLRDADGQLHSLQYIAPDKRLGRDRDRDKDYLAGGRVAGCCYTVSDRADGPLAIAEGYATAASVYEATHCAAVAALHCGNLLAVAQAIRAKCPEREIVIAADSDQWTDGNPGLSKATETARAVNAKLAVPQFRDTTTKPTDFNDLHQLEGLDKVKEQIDGATAPKETDDEFLARLAALPPLEYERQREEAAKRLDCRAAILDKLVESRRPKAAAAETAQGSRLSFPEVEPWEQPVNGAELLNEIAATMKRFIVAPTLAIVAAALFTLHTYAFDLGDISPILFITGPTKRCGKSKFLAVLSRLVSRPFAASSATPAGIYRTIELHHPTLCIDEVDSFVRGDEQLRGLINCGHTRDAAFRLGCAAIGDKDFEPRRWSTWTPKIFSGIGRLADTVEDRAIIIEMRRRLKSEPVERLRHGMQFTDIPRKAVRFVNDHAEAIRNGSPPTPEELNDRAADNWTPLLTLADLAGGDWPTLARQAALSLSGGDVGEGIGTGGQLLADIRDIFEAAGADRLASKDLAGQLAELEGRSWAEYGRARRPISPNQLANLLRDFKVFPKAVRIGDKTPKGYALDDFAEALSRYLPPKATSDPQQRNSPGKTGAKCTFQNATPEAVLRVENAVPPARAGQCCVVADHEAPECEKEEELRL